MKINCQIFQTEAAQLGEYPPRMHEVLSSIPSRTKTRHGGSGQACHPCTGEVEEGGSGVQGHLQLHSELKVSLRHVRLTHILDPKTCWVFKWLRFWGEGEWLFVVLFWGFGLFVCFWSN